MLKGSIQVLSYPINKALLIASDTNGYFSFMPL